MLQSVAQDLLATADLELHVLADARLAPFWPDACCAHQVDRSRDERRLLRRLAKNCDITLLIAPDFDNLLWSRCQWVARAGGTLLTPAETFVALAANKRKLADHLKAAGLPVPRSFALVPGESPPDDFPFPAVLKPTDGAGSLDVQLVRAASQLQECRASRHDWRLEQSQQGTPASVAVLCGPKQTIVLEPGQQILSTDGQLRYLGGAWPLERGQRQRAVTLAARVVSAMPETRGYVGIDLVLGAADDGRDDVVIEVNPRLTTSYVGLRQMTKTNLAAAMLRVAEGLPVTVTWKDQGVTFKVDDLRLGAQPCIG